MNGLNKAYLLGRLGAEPEMRVTSSGKKLAKVSLATSNRIKVNDEWVDSTDWHRITAWDRDAEYLERFAHKGDALCVECAIRPSRWTDQEGKPRYEVNLVTQRIHWLQSRSRSTEAAATRPGPDAGDSADSSTIPMPMPPAESSVGEEEMPF